MIDILPGEISAPDWDGPRCSGCGQPLGEGFDRCSQYAEEGLPPKAHLTIESIADDVKQRWFTNKIWSNAQEMLGTLDAIHWMAQPNVSLGGLKPVDAVRAGKGSAVLELQFAEWPRLQAVANALRKLKQQRAA